MILWLISLEAKRICFSLYSIKKNTKKILFSNFQKHKFIVWIDVSCLVMNRLQVLRNPEIEWILAEDSVSQIAMKHRMLISEEMSWIPFHRHQRTKLQPEEDTETWQIMAWRLYQMNQLLQQNAQVVTTVSEAVTQYWRQPQSYSLEGVCLEQTLKKPQSCCQEGVC